MSPFPVANIPIELRDLYQWVGWKPIVRGDNPKPTKVPYQPCGTREAKSNDPDTWCSFDEAIHALSQNKIHGIGFVFSATDPYFGLDLDHVRDPQTNQITDWTDAQRACEHWQPVAPDPQQIIDVLSTDCYCEISPSRTGIHLIGRGELARGRKLGDLEIYKLGRFFTITGDAIGTAPSPLKPCTSMVDALMRVFDAKPKSKPKPKPAHHHSNGQSPSPPPSPDIIIAKARTASNATLFSSLFDGGFPCPPYQSHSEADAALCGILAFYSARDPLVIDAVIRQSKLYRDKWDDPHSSDGRTYGEITSENAIAGCTEYYDWASPGKPIPKSYSLPPATFTVKSADARGKKISVTIELSIDGKPIDAISFTSAASNRSAAVKAIKQRCFCGDDPTTPQQIDAVLGTIFVDVSRPTEKPKSEERPPEAKDIHEILEEIIPPIVQLAYRTDSGKAYSRVLGDEISRGEFVAYCTNKSIIVESGKAFDAPRDEDENVIRSKLIPAVKQELEVLWGHIIGQLKTIDGAELTDDDRAVSDFRQLIIDLWTRPCAMGIHAQQAQKGQSVQLATRASMASKVRRMKQENTVEYYDKWTPIHESYSAYYRDHASLETKGEPVPYLAMKFELFSQIGVKPKGITKRIFKAMSIRYGTTAVSEPVTDRMSDGGRLIILSRLMTNRILYAPSDDEPQPPTINPDASEQENASLSDDAHCQSPDEE